jgi:small-conductance mechanosensitive channel
VKGGLITAAAENVSLGYTVLRDTDGHELILPNSVMVTSMVIRIERAPGGTEPRGA